jgi:iron(III) transport system ATP-binding protein
MSTVELRNISKHFDRVQVLHSLSLSIGEGEFFTLLGPSGCGKTTTLRLIAGFASPDAGSIFVDGEEVSHLPPEKRGMGMVFQNYALFPHLNVKENVEFGLRMHGIPNADASERIEKYLHLVRLEGYGKRRINQLSGGQQQRVALARALAIEPRILLLDEPLSNLDAKLREEMRLELRSIQKKLGTTTIYVTHDQSEALAMSDRVAVFEKGRCTQIGRPEEIYNAPANRFIASFVGVANLVPCRILSRSQAKTRIDVLGAVVEIDAPGETDYGDSPSLCIRPEGIATCPSGEGIFDGVFVDAVFNGATVTVTVRVGDVILVAGILNDGNSILPSPGGRMGLRLKERGATLVASHEETGNA